MKLKLVTIEGKTYAEVEGDKPLYEAADGKVVAFDAPSTVATINRITEESKGFKTRAQTAEEGLKAFEGIEDPDAARAALETVSSLDDGQLLSAGKVDEIKKGVETAVEAKYANIIKTKDKTIETLSGERDGLASSLDKEVIGGGIARSKYVAEKLVLPPDIVETYFGPNFKREDGKVVGYDASGTKIFSRSNPAEPADIDEALEVLVDAYPRKEHILKGTGAQGSGAQGGNGGGGAKTIIRSQFDALPQNDRAAKIKDGFTVVDAA